MIQKSNCNGVCCTSSGMNFDYMPELHWHFSYYVFWVIVICTTALAAAWVRGAFTSGMVANRQRMEIM